MESPSFTKTPIKNIYPVKQFETIQN